MLYGVHQMGGWSRTYLPPGADHFRAADHAQLEFSSGDLQSANHPDFSAQNANVESSASLGTINSTSSTSRETQFALKAIFCSVSVVRDRDEIAIVAPAVSCLLNILNHTRNSICSPSRSL